MPSADAGGAPRRGELVSRLRASWDSMPRAGRWLVFAAIAFGAYFAVVEPVLNWTADLGARADALQAGLDRQAARSRSGAAGVVAVGLSRFGAAATPGRGERSGELNARLEQILRERRVASLSIRARAPVPLGRSAMDDVIGEGEQVQRLILDIDFESSPEVAAAVLADLEQAREVASVGRISMRRLDRGGQRSVQVSLSPEAWVVAPRGGGR